MLRKILFNRRITYSLIPPYRNLYQNNFKVYDRSRFFSSDSFMQAVINQVKKDLEKDKSLQEAMEKLESESQISEKFSKLSEYIDKTMDFSKECITKISETKDNSKIIRKCLDSAKNIAVGFDKVSSYLYDEKGHAKRIKRKMNLHNKRKSESVSKQQCEEANDKSDKTEGVDGNKEKEGKMSSETNETERNEDGDPNVESSLVVAKESVWDRFGSKIRDMPFLSEFFENPIVSKLFGESSLAAALREMKRIDSSFNLPDLMELVEHVIAPHVVECYLKGDHDSLKLHCGEVAFNILNTSIKERNVQNLVLDPSILILKDVELKGGMKMKDGDPWFIFNFTTQQINCLRNNKGQVCAGQIDDIREVIYSIAISKHPKPIDVLEYPYMVNEIAIISNKPCW